MKHQKLRLGQTKIYHIVLSSLVMERFMPIAYVGIRIIVIVIFGSDPG